MQNRIALVQSMRSLVCGLALVLGAGMLGQSGWVQAWTCSLSVRPEEGKSRVLQFGVDAQATAGIDASLGEIEQPPLPPPGFFDVRFAGAGLGNGTLVDMRPFSPADQCLLEVAFQRAAGEPLILSWDVAAIAARTTAAKLQDPFGGVLVDVDMRTTGQVVIDNAALAALILSFTAAAIDAPAETTQLAFAVLPDSVVSGEPFKVQVRAEDKSGARALNFNETVNLVLVSGNGILAGTRSAAAAKGLALFEGVVYTTDELGALFALRADDQKQIGSDLPPVTSSPLQVALPVAPLHWVCSLKVSEKGLGFRNLQFGMRPFATDGIDAALGEVEQPPLPPVGTFDVRFGNGALVDLRLGSPGVEYSLSLRFQRAVGGDITISWDRAILAAGTKVARLQDPSGSVVSVDMRTASQVQITNVALNSLKLIIVPEGS